MYTSLGTKSHGARERFTNLYLVFGQTYFYIIHFCRSQFPSPLILSKCQGGTPFLLENYMWANERPFKSSKILKIISLINNIFIMNLFYTVSSPFSFISMSSSLTSRFSSSSRFRPTFCFVHLLYPCPLNPVLHLQTLPLKYAFFTHGSKVKQRFALLLIKNK